MRNTFTADINKFIAKNQKREELFLRKVTLASLGGVQITSPVDTGRFRGDWHITIGSENGERVNQSYKYNANNDIYIVNTLDYAVSLENGLSAQAPNGIIRVVAKQVKTKIEQGAFSSD